MMLARPQEHSGEVRQAMVGFCEKPAGAGMPLWVRNRMDAAVWGRAFSGRAEKALDTLTKPVKRVRVVSFAL